MELTMGIWTPSTEPPNSTVDTNWAIAGMVPADALIAARGQLPAFLQADSRIVTGNGGMLVLLVFDGPTCDGEYLASTLSEEHRTPVYFLDFDEYAPRVKRFEGARVELEEGHPGEFLRRYGITPPGYEPMERSRVVSVGVVEGATLDQACKAMLEIHELFTANKRGVLVRDVSGLITTNLAKALRRREYTVYYDQADKRFLCTTSEPSCAHMDGFSLGGWPTASCRVVPSILGETTIDGILRALDIPRHMVFPK
jgi:hypothetical protein